MYIETLHKTFNSQTNYIGFGNVLSNTEFGFIVRPSNYRNDYIQKDNQAQDYDVKQLRTFCPIFQMYENVIRNISNTHSGVFAHLFFHRYHGKKIFHGIIVISKDKKNVKLFPLRYKEKSFDILEKAKMKLVG